jgi:putative transposase
MQFTGLVMAQLSGRNSLRDIVENLAAQAHRLYHLGSGLLSRSNLSRMNEEKPYELYEALFGKLLERCQQHVPGHNFKFKNSLYSLDASTIDLCLSVFPWADFRTTKGAIKLHVGLNHAGYLPEFIQMTEGATHEVNIGKLLNFPKGGIIAMDRGYTDYSWYNALNDRGIFFVTRLKKNADYQVIKRHTVDKCQGLTSDQVIRFSNIQKAKDCPTRLRRIGYRDPETGKHYVFLTNHMKLSAKTIADIYKSRWQIELFFKWIKQNLKIKSFIGTSKNAVMTQIWIAMCVYLILSYLKFQSKLDKSLQQILRILQLNLFEKRDLMALLRGDPPTSHLVNDNQLVLL